MKDEKCHDLKIMSGTINLEIIVASVSAFRSSIIGPKYVYKKTELFWYQILIWGCCFNVLI